MAKKSSRSWREKVEAGREAKVVEITAKTAGRFGARMGQKMIIPTPKDVEIVIRQVKEGELITPSILRKRLASLYQVDLACPLTTGIFLWIVAHAAFEDIQMRRATQRTVTPYWRVVKNDGTLFHKFPGGVDVQKTLLEEEGYTIEERASKGTLRVKEFERYLVRPG